jgi:hypothetical protein
MQGGTYRANDTGTRYFSIGRAAAATNNTLVSQGVTDAWSVNPSTVSASLELHAAAAETFYDFSKDGLVMFEYSKLEGLIYQWNFSTPFDLTTAEDAGIVYDLGPEFTVDEDDGQQIVISPSGRAFYLVNLRPASGQRQIDQFVLLKKNSLASVHTAGFFQLPVAVLNPQGMTFNGDGSELHLGDITNPEPDAEMFEFTLNNPYSVGGVSGGVVGNKDARGMISVAGTVYTVFGREFSVLSDTGELTLIDPNLDGSGPVGMATDGDILVITAGGARYKFDPEPVTSGDIGGSANKFLVQFTSPNLEETFTVAYLDSRFWYEQPDGIFAASELNDPTTVDGLDKGTAESLKDDLLAVFVHNQYIYLCGVQTIEPWLSTGVSRPPAQRQDVIERGIIGRRAINSIDNVIYFLDDTRRPNRMSNLQYETMYTPALGEEFDSYTVVDDCIVSTYAFEQENFVDFIFPSEDKTWTYHENSGLWSKRENSNQSRYQVQYYVGAYNRLLGLDKSNGTVYEFSVTTYQDDGSDITRIVDSELITSELYGVEGQEMVASELTLTISTQTGGGTMTVTLTKDPASSSPTFLTSRTINLVAGSRVYDILRWGRFREGVFRITTTENDNVELVDMALEVELLRG